MALHRAVGCDTTGCLALYLSTPTAGPDLVLFAAERAGWGVTAGGLVMRCPSCRTHGLAVTERGNCPVCTGSTHDGPHGETCHHCGHTVPHPAVDEIGDEVVAGPAR
ncbi:hypothetical protein [Streptomyces heilongjiangensis]|uniref:Uncharacterized protein n=1 Tax=Streptomyces heilongjiangensis TaxID=945052 RepID=A0ABW1BHH1_9ACTN|nr:hypothetical protein [Streptomyces heilongjiangensis]MDC2951088.1 hypothetical protein [Streptomyces heilongjiangensis]